MLNERQVFVILVCAVCAGPALIAASFCLRGRWRDAGLVLVGAAWGGFTVYGMHL